MDAQRAREHVATFLDSGVPHPTLGLVYGRRRIGKTTLLYQLSTERRGFYWEATRGAATVQRARLGEALGEHLGVGPLAFDTWEQAVRQLIRLGRDAPTPVAPVVIDEFGYLLESDPAVDSVFANVLGAAQREGSGERTRLVLCGSAIALMRSLLAGEAPLRGRAGMELVMQPFGFREAALAAGMGSAPDLAARIFAVIGGVIGYYSDMVDHDLPRERADFERWVCQRVLSPAATLHHEATTLLAEDPALAAANASVQHSALGAIANGSVTAGGIANRLGRTVSNLDPVLKRLIAAGFVVRHEDPLRAQRPTYALADPLLQFHYAVLEPHGALLRARDPAAAWRQRLSQTFDSRVRGPVFEEMARTWVRRHAAPGTLGGFPDHVGPSVVSVDGKERELDVVVAEAQEAPISRTVRALGEAKAGEVVGGSRLRSLEHARQSLGPRAANARLLLFAHDFTDELRRAVAARDDVELVDLVRLYSGE